MAPRTALHLCSGYGGFELALRDHGVRTVAHVERDAYAAATLVARMGETRLDQAPVWDDLCTFDGRPWRGRVDLITAGFPCQPFSAAGQRRGLDDDRWLWPAIARIIADVRPGWVMLENVPGVVRAGLPAVLHDLAQLGFDAEWGLLPASAVGAPHKRERWWCVAQSLGLKRQPASTERPVAIRDDPRRQGDDVGHAGGAGRSEVARGAHGDEGTHGPQHRDLAHGAGEDVDDAAGAGLRGRLGGGQAQEQPALAVGCGHAHRFPPRPDDPDGWKHWDGPQPGVRRGADGAADWLADALHLGGNGLVPQCAAEAWRQLTGRLNDD